MKDFDDPSLSRVIRDSMTDPTLRALRQIEELKNLRATSAEAQLERLLGNPDVSALRRQVLEGEQLRGLLRDAFSNRYESLSEATALRAAAQANRLSTQFLGDSIIRAAKTFHDDSSSRLLQSLDPIRFSDPLAQLDRAATELARSIRWSDLNPLRAAATFDVWAEAFADLPDLTISEDDEIVLNEDVVISAEDAIEIIAQSAYVVEQAKDEVATKKDLQDATDVIVAQLDELARKQPTAAQMFMNTWIIPFFMGAALEVGSAILQQRGAFDPAPAPRAEIVTEKPQLYRVKGDDLALRAEPSTDSDIRLRLNRDEMLTALEWRDDGWLRVRARVQGDSHIEGWVALVHVEPSR